MDMFEDDAIIGILSSPAATRAYFLLQQIKGGDEGILSSPADKGSPVQSIFFVSSRSALQYYHRNNRRTVASTLKIKRSPLHLSLPAYYVVEILENLR
ncbi:hypothetical protein L2E82_10358 [Cichorium intybus]|uniref:Uncharacterized protein n=1 Tax=Cichorium intybus TaxID=13427 RepID=A0ACB9GBD8_CICIN|nr:hypothetical protein L2E82_10358 [Cichorium intybus]